MEEEKREEAQAQGEGLSSLWQEALKEQEGKEKEEKREVLTPDIQEKLKKFLDLPLLIEVVVGSTTLTLGGDSELGSRLCGRVGQLGGRTGGYKGERQTGGKGRDSLWWKIGLV
jgi:hydrogenase maturation factor HypE